MPDRMSPLDASFLHFEDDVTHMHIGCISIFEGPPPPYERLKAMVEGKLGLVPRYRQVVRTVPFQLGRPVWVADPHFNLEYHLRRTALPEPGDDEELRRLVEYLMAQQLDRSKPLWELWMVEGVGDGDWALVSKVHHCMVDGVSGTDLMALVLDLSPDAEPAAAVSWHPERPPSPARLAADALAERAMTPFEYARTVRAATRVPRLAAHHMAETVAGFWAAAGVVRSSASSLNGPLGPYRRWAGTTTTVEDVKTVRHVLGGTFNDVLLAAITNGFRELLLSRGELIDVPVRTLVPVSVRPRDVRGRAIGDGTLANKVSAIFADLPVYLDDPASRLHAISAQMQGVKESRQAIAGEILTSATGFAPPVLLALAGRLIARTQKQVNTLATNVPGPQMPLYAAGRRMTRCYPFTPLGAGLRIGVAMFSYDGDVAFGITADYDSTPDIDVLVAGIDEGMADLVDAAGRAAPARVSS